MSADRSFAAVADRLNLLSRIVTAACWIEEGAVGDAHSVLVALEAEIVAELERDRDRLEEAA